MRILISVIMFVCSIYVLTNALKILSTEKDFYDSEAKTNKVMAVAAIVSPLNPGANLSKKLLGNPAMGELLDGFNTFMQFSNDPGALNGLKQRIHKEESAKKR
jgi:arginine exporter protein ArgO